MRFLVTGGAGFIGSHLSESLLNDGHFIVCIDNFNTYYNPERKRQNISKIVKHPNFRVIEEDILNFKACERLFKNEDFNVVVHLAARAGVRPSIEQPFLYQRVNIQGTMNLLELCKRYQIQKFIFASSSSVYGANKKVPFHEDDPVDNPVSTYAATKKAGELVCYTYHSLYNISVNCLRFFTVYGPRQRPDMAIHKFTRLIDEGQAIPVFGRGNSQRDYTFIKDIIQGLRGAIDHCNGYRIYNLGESHTVKLLDLINVIEDSLGKEAKLNFLPEQKGDVPITFADIARAQSELGYHPKTLIKEGVKKFVQWYKAQ